MTTKSTETNVTETKSTQAAARPGSGSRAQTVPAGAAGDAARLQAHGFDTMTGLGTAWAEALSDMGSEVLSFVADRIKEDVKTQHQILHCKDVGELQKIQADFIQTAIDQYTAETGRLVEMSQDLFRVPGTARGRTDG